MKTSLQIKYDEGRIATFTGVDGKGVFRCPNIMPHHMVWHANGRRFNEVVEIEDPVSKWLGSAIITRTDTEDTGTTFQLEFPSSLN